PALGAYEVRASLASFEPQPPFEPFDRMLPADAYWAAKRIAAVPEERIRRALAAGRMTDASSAARALFVLEVRRAKILEWAFAAVTPVEVEAVSASKLTLRDEAITLGVGAERGAQYAIDYLDAGGALLASTLHLAPKGAVFEVPLPSPGPSYLVVRARVTRGGIVAPRACELHVVRDRAGARVIGVRH
ncbi:MAG: hypothetical protein ABI193_05065, partial [Minicystis sp.]